jgi:hypothetical protein
MRTVAATLFVTLLCGAPQAYAKATLRDQPVTAPQPHAEPVPAGPGFGGTPSAAPAGGAPAGAAAARGGSAALPEVPQIGDEPLPEWKPPTVKLSRRQALFLSLSPEVQRAQQMRQAGLWLASFGGVSLLVGGIIEGTAIDLAGDIGTPKNGIFDPRVEDQKDLLHTTAVSIFAIGGTLAVTGMTLFIAGQHRIKSWHSEHPGDPLPPLSGY